jgi:hypothetical protein
MTVTIKGIHHSTFELERSVVHPGLMMSTRSRHAYQRQEVTGSPKTSCSTKEPGTRTFPITPVLAENTGPGSTIEPAYPKKINKSQ